MEYKYGAVGYCDLDLFREKWRMLRRELMPNLINSKIHLFMAFWGAL
jgi:hypothetical protein